MMKLKKLFALALAGVMTLALFTGCGDKPGDKSDEAIRAILMNINNAADSEKPSDKNKDGGEDGDDENGGSNK